MLQFAHLFDILQKMHSLNFVTYQMLQTDVNPFGLLHDQIPEHFLQLEHIYHNS
jgi:hypothetical protein